MSIERIKLGEERVRRITLKPGTYSDGTGHVIVSDREFQIDAVEVYHYQYRHSMQGTLGWTVDRYNWESVDELRKSEPPAPPVETLPEPEPISWWRRLFGLGPKLPTARVVER